MDWNRTVVTQNAKETQKLGQELAASLMEKKEGSILYLSGELGSGKTTFLQGFAQGLGITTRLLSPTFIIVRRYDIPKQKRFFYHIDLYRVNEDTILENLGLSDIFADTNSIIAVEWPERLGNYISREKLNVTFEVMGEKERRVTFVRPGTKNINE